MKIIRVFAVLLLCWVLLRLLFPSVYIGTAPAAKAQAKNDVVQIATALMAYKTEYGRFPVAADTPMRVEGELLAALTGKTNENNPRGIVFIEVQPARAGKSGIKNGVFVDPWGGSYKVVLDADNDGQATSDPHMGSKTISKSVAVWNDTSEHPDAAKRNNSARRQVTSWD